MEEDPEEAAGPPPPLVEVLVELAGDPPVAPELLVLPLEALDALEAPPLAPVPPVVVLELPHAQRPALSSTADTPRNTRVDFMSDG